MTAMVGGIVKKCHYSVIQYIPDPIADERVNIGIVAWDSEIMRFRFLDDWRRVETFYPKSIPFITIVAAEISEQSDPGMLEHIIDKWMNVLQFTPRRGSLGCPETVVETLWPLFIAPTPPDKTLLLHWGTCAIAITRLAEIPADLTEENPIVLIDGNIRQPPIGHNRGRNIEEYVCDPEYWAIDPEDMPGTLPDRPPWAKQLIEQLFRAIDAGNLALAQSLVEVVEGSIGLDDPELARAAVLIRRKEILGR